mgnify:CR=1 FL=1
MKSKYYGVYHSIQRTGNKSAIVSKSKKPWKAQLTIDNVSNNLGSYATEKEAAIAVDKRLIQLGKLDKLNILKPKTND